MTKISVVVIAKNEEDMIKTCLESVKWVDEIIVVDNGSIDKTSEIAKSYSNKVFKLRSNDFSETRNFGMGKTTGDWVLYIDSDERVLEPLREEIKVLIENEKYSAYAISRKNIFFGKPVNYGPYKEDWIIRLLRKKDFEGWIGQVHEYPKFSGNLGYTKNSLIHLTHRNIDQIVFKSLEWSKIDAKLRLDSNHPKMNAWRFLRIINTEFFNQIVIRKGLFGGTVGIIDSILQTFSLFITYVRLWQMQQKDFEESYKKIDQKLLENEFKEI